MSKTAKFVPKILNCSDQYMLKETRNGKGNSDVEIEESRTFCYYFHLNFFKISDILLRRQILAFELHTNRCNLQSVGVCGRGE